ncbi:P-type ATPase [Tieghemostelium lacteum]|uniref:P-type ATPase n=1 Tax=Tieghemostelium lacteum TaxID=361077 RepID=A0A151ZB12_TIELA|nr:P-type ATPase [Tieghemostelium lacteum]|eukprot:KYQ91143.1 P-type ATPase [Tieghemostelium lacteum]
MAISSQLERCSCSCVSCLCNDLVQSFVTPKGQSNKDIIIPLSPSLLASCCSTQSPTGADIKISSPNNSIVDSERHNANCSCSTGTCCNLSSLFKHTYFRIIAPSLQTMPIDELETLRSKLLQMHRILTVRMDAKNKMVEIESKAENGSVFSILNVFKQMSIRIVAIQSKECPTNPLMDIDDQLEDSPLINKQQTATENLNNNNEYTNTRLFQIDGMVCELGCANRIESTLYDNPKVQKAEINFQMKILSVQASAQLSDKSISRIIHKLGFKCKRIHNFDVSDETTTNNAQVPDLNITSSDEEGDLDDNPHQSIELNRLDEIKIVTPTIGEITSVVMGVYGMTCASCVGIVENGIKSVPGVIECSVNLLAERAEIKYQPEVAKVQDIMESLDFLGYETKLIESSKPGSFFIRILNEPDQDSVNRSVKSIQTLHGVMSVQVSTESSDVIKVECDSTVVGPRTIINLLKSQLELQSELYNPDSSDAKESLLRKREIEKWRKLFIFSIAFTAPLIVIAMILVPITSISFLHYKLTQGLPVESLIGFVLATPVQIVSGWGFYKNSWAALRNLHGNMDLLVAIGSTAAYAYSIISIVIGMVNPDFMGMHFFETSASLITFIILGRWLENIAKGHTSSAIVKLMNLQTKESVLVQGSIDKSSNSFTVTSEEIIPSNLIQYGDILKVIPGSSVPTDGTIVSGQSSIDESMLTGESIPVTKKQGDIVTGGTLNLDGLLYIQANKIGSESTLSQIISLVQQAQTSKAPIQALADTISKYFVPGILIIGIVTFVLWISAAETGNIPLRWQEGTSPFLFSFLTAISVVVIACPCALGLATPTAVMVGTGVGATMGILIKGGKALETAHKTTAVLFDKTGTITTGKMTVTDCQVADEFLEIVGAAESSSEHPIGRAITQYCKDKLSISETSQLPSVEDFKGIPGRGLQCSIQSKSVLIGNLSFMKENQISVSSAEIDYAQQLETNGKTVIYVSVDGKFCGTMGISDIPREDSRHAIKKLTSMGLKCYMVTGDNRRAARFIADSVGIKPENIFSEVIPKEKAEKVEQLQLQGNVVCFVGDGINDSPALSQADIGISVATGTDIAIESSSIVLLKNSLTDVYRSIHLSRVVFRRIRINFTLALIYNLLAVPLAAGLFRVIFNVGLPPMAAAAAMVVSSLSVLTSSLLLKLYKSPKSSNQ